ncbi:hypothetical protein [Paenibacillus aestuarii]|uniref:Uncharacterized protein n=1 Tax=Paenibacillus aestuarii TaxID=516965 RepID=A0ABW0KCZ3_9BACL|nr:hypothetical protein [Paenibacillus aestuarii]
MTDHAFKSMIMFTKDLELTFRCGSFVASRLHAPVQTILIKMDENALESGGLCMMMIVVKSFDGAGYTRIFGRLEGIAWNKHSETC